MMIEKMLLRLMRRARREEGNSLVEMALVSAFVFLPMMFGIIQFSYALYAYNFVNMAARQATRYAAVRGAPSCLISSTFVDCNLGPSGGSNPTTTSGSAALQTYVQSLTYPGINANNLTVTATWLEKVVTTGSGIYSTTSWSTACTSTDNYLQACNTPGDAVQVTVTYQFPLAIPFWKSATLNLTGTSQMVINE